MGDIPVIVRDFGKLEFPYGGSTFIAALMLAKHMEFSLRGLHTSTMCLDHIHLDRQIFPLQFNPADDIRGARILELGAGTGIHTATC